MLEEPDVDADLVQSANPRFVLVTGAGRSGTSTVSGSLYFLGLHLPFPVLGTNKSNPRGFYESKWAIDFHRKIFDRALIDNFDARPEALDDIKRVLTPDDQLEIEGWLREQSKFAPQLVVKDPRSAWMPRLWADAADAVGLQTGYLTMLRHPAEVTGSRSTYYAKGDPDRVSRYQVTSVARWINANLICERQTRTAPRSFVRYDALIADWRSTLEGVRTELDLTFNTDLSSSERHPVDEFIDPTLRRHEVTWDDLDVPDNLREVAEDTWNGLCHLADRHGHDDDIQGALDELTSRYSRLFRDASAIAHDVAAADAKRARRKALRETRQKLRADQQAAPQVTPNATAAATVRARAGSAARGWARRGKALLTQGRRTG